MKQWFGLITGRIYGDDAIKSVIDDVSSVLEVDTNVVS